MAPVSAPAVWLTTLALSLPDLLAHDSSTSLTVPEQSRREGRLFACHSERSEESLSFHAQGRLREASRSGLKSMREILRFAQNDNVRQFFISLLRKFALSPLFSVRPSPARESH